jgi:arylsulfatase
MFKSAKKIMIRAVGIALISMTAARAAEKPNIIFILVDDMGWSDLGCYGSEIRTPNIDSLAADGIRFTQFYNTAKCNTTRASLLTGLYHQQCDMTGPNVMKNSATLGEVLRPAGYRTLASGKHHGTENLFERGFDRYYGLRDGCCNFWNPGDKREGEPAPARKTARYWCDNETTMHPYTPEDRNFYTTDAFTDKALEWLDEPELNEKPFFLYLAYTAPHFPLHAWPEDIAKYEGLYDNGYLPIREARYARMINMGLIDPAKNPLPEWDGSHWDELEDLERRKEIRRMEIYAAMMDRLDQNIGRVLNKLKEQGKLENTLILFASDNGACPDQKAGGGKEKSTRLEDFGKVNSYETVGQSWATVQDTPLRKWKGFSHEGGIRTPLIVTWPAGIKNTGGFYREPGHVIDIMPTLIELTGAIYPEKANKQAVLPMQGVSLLPAFEGRPLVRPAPLYWEYSEGFAIRDGDMKAVRLRRAKDKEWELYDFSKDENETIDLAPAMPEKLSAMKQRWQQWYNSVSSYETGK